MQIRISYFTICFIITLGAFHQNTNAQKNKQTYISDKVVIHTNDKIDAESFHAEIFQEMLIDKINIILHNRNKELIKSDEILSKAANDQANYMAKIDNTTTLQSFREKATTALRVQIYGGSMSAKEIVEKINISKGRIPLSYDKICDELVLKLFNNSKKAQLIQNNEFNLIGIGAHLNTNKKKLYISYVLGNYKSNNKGTKHKSKLALPYTNKYYGLTAPHPKYCRKVNKTNNLFELQKGLIVENGYIYYETENAKQLKRLVKNSKDGIAVDILQKEQFNCAYENIIDYNNLNRGILTKRVFAKKLFKKNLANTEDNRHALKTRLGDLPEGLKEDYELNLILIQNKSICKSIPQSFLLKTSGTYFNKVELLADTITINSLINYKPEADSLTLSFKIPFENKKYTYKKEDIIPFLNSLNEPAFIINDLEINAFSSIEGTDKENVFLQEARAKSITNALKDRQQEDIATKINTDYNWIEFQTDIKKTKHRKLAEMSLEEAQTYIRKNNLKKELESILKNHRYAEINMKVTYDLSREHEQPHVLKDFNEAINSWDRVKALSIQKYIIKQIIKNNYNISALDSLIIPDDEQYAGMKMNQLYFQNRYGTVSTTDFTNKLESLYKLDSDNEYIAFNHLLNTINNCSLISTIDNYGETQSKLDRLYFTPLKKKTVDALNIKYQFKLIAATDSTLNHPKIKSAAINKIKEIIDIREESMSNSLKLAEIFIENNDYTFAQESLAPWVDKTQNEELIFTYLSLSSTDEWLMHKQRFTTALKRASELNKKRYCELFNGEKFSLRVLENVEVKEDYCRICNEIE